MSSFNRHIDVPGDALLPPSRTPLIPNDIKDGERVLVRPPVAPAQDDNRYWVLIDGFRQHPTDATFGWRNEPPHGPYGMGRGVDLLPVPSTFQFKPKARKNGLPDFWQAYGLLVMSTRLLDLVLETDPQAIVHKPIVMMDLEGNVFDEDHHFVDVIRAAEAVDYANSFVVYQGGEDYEGRRIEPRPASYYSVRILEDIDPSWHLFRHDHRSPIVSNHLHQKIKRMKPAVSNVGFNAPASGI
ncbi:MAG TPA: DUF1629 domain-containing protein [Allosphingosinicella sp.]|jgi:hypothetical protein